ncbi:MAG: ATP-grasp domain-containing protein [Pseudomonadota bacterium]
MNEKLKILVLIGPNLTPPKDVQGYNLWKVPWRTEYYVITTLKSIGHDVKVIEVIDDLSVIRKAKKEFEPHIAFNLLEAFDSETLQNYALVSYLEMIKLPYTGCNPKGLMLSRDKGLSKKLLHYHRIKMPVFDIAKIGKNYKRSRKLEFPLIVKSLTEEGSVGISQASIVNDDEKLNERIKFIHDNTLSHALIESYVEGKDIYVSLIGNKKVEVFPLLELQFKNLPKNIYKIASSKVKWSPEYREKYKIDTEVCKYTEEQTKKIKKLSRKIYHLLELSGYARLDLRICESGQIYFLEANPNPEIARPEDFAYSAKHQKINYPKLLNKIMDLGIKYSQNN